MDKVEGFSAKEEPRHHPFPFRWDEKDGAAPKVFTIHNIHTSGKEYPHYARLFAISDGVRNYTRQQGYDAVTVWNGLTTAAINQKTQGWYQPGDIYRMVCVGRLYAPHKGQDILLEALGRIKQQGITAFHVDLIGDGESRASLEQQAKAAGIEEQVTFCGQQNRDYIYQHLCDYDLFVLPSRSEGFGLSVAEAMSAKVPVIVCDLEGVKDVVGGGQYGCLFRAGNSESLAKQICTFLQKQTSLQKVEEAYGFATVHFDIRNTAKRYLEEYRKVIKS